MNRKIGISAFHHVLSAPEDDDQILKLLRKLREVKDPGSFSKQKRGPMPLGAWAGWSL